MQLDTHYPRYNEQKRQHEEFKKKLQELKKIHSEGGLNLSLVMKTQKFMSEWWVEHITKLDMDLGVHVNR